MMSLYCVGNDHNVAKKFKVGMFHLRFSCQETSKAKYLIFYK